jgi:hypothetical protein
MPPARVNAEEADMELTVATILVAFAGVFLICFMKGAFGGGFSIVGIPLLSIVMDPVTDKGDQDCGNRQFHGGHHHILPWSGRVMKPWTAASI